MPQLPRSIMAPRLNRGLFWVTPDQCFIVGLPHINIRAVRTGHYNFNHQSECKLMPVSQLEQASPVLPASQGHKDSSTSAGSFHHRYCSPGSHSASGAMDGVIRGHNLASMVQNCEQPFSCSY